MDQPQRREQRPPAFVLAGSFLVVCRSPAYLDELARRGLKILLITPAGARDETLARATDPAHPAAGIHDFAFVEGDPGRDGSFVPGAVAAALRWREEYDIVGACAVGETQVEPVGLLADALGLWRAPPRAGATPPGTARQKGTE